MAKGTSSLAATVWNAFVLKSIRTLNFKEEGDGFFKNFDSECALLELLASSYYYYYY
jgi:hypothetical protein